MVSPVTVHVVVGAATVQLRPPGLAVTVYDVMADPPSEAGVDHETATWPFPGAAVTDVGGPGTVAGVTELDAGDAGVFQVFSRATTSNVYAVPLASPVTSHVAEPVSATVHCLLASCTARTR